MSDHTPGPWIVAPNGHCVLSDAPALDGIPRGVGVFSMNARTAKEARANAQLCAAGPELLESSRLQEEADEAALTVGRLGRNPDPEQLQAAITHYNDLRVKAQTLRRLALAKVAGRPALGAMGSEVAA